LLNGKTEVNQPDKRVRVVIFASLVHYILWFDVSVADAFHMHVV